MVYRPKLIAIWNTQTFSNGASFVNQKTTPQMYCKIKVLWNTSFCSRFAVYPLSEQQLLLFPPCPSILKKLVIFASDGVLYTTLCPLPPSNQHTVKCNMLMFTYM